MEALFLKLFNMSITAGWLILAILLLRCIFRKHFPRNIFCFLWSLVAIRLICPIYPESVTSLVPSPHINTTLNMSALTKQSDSLTETTPDIHNLPTYNDTEGITHVSIPDSQVQVTQEIDVIPYGDGRFTIPTIFGKYIWPIGIVLFLVYTLFSYIRLKRRTNECILLRDNIWLCDHISTPFILGIIRPQIFLPSAMAGEDSDLTYVLAHEQAHLKRLDYLWKPLGFMLLAIYWFNPLIWIAYILFCRDIELACDEKAVRNYDTEERKAYSTALLNCSVPRHIISACPLAFGETHVKNRIKSVLHYKKPTVWMLGIAFVILLIVVLCFMTDPKNGSEPTDATNTESSTDELTDETDGSITLQYKNPWEMSPAGIMLNPEDHTFTFSYSLFSSYFAVGTYEETDKQLILTTSDDFDFRYVFNRDGKNYIFDKSASSSIPSYKYTADGPTKEAVPDGATFITTNGTYELTECTIASLYDDIDLLAQETPKGVQTFITQGTLTTMKTVLNAQDVNMLVDAITRIVTENELSEPLSYPEFTGGSGLHLVFVLENTYVHFEIRTTSEGQNYLHWNDHHYSFEQIAWTSDLEFFKELNYAEETIESIYMEPYFDALDAQFQN